MTVFSKACLPARVQPSAPLALHCVCALSSNLTSGLDAQDAASDAPKPARTPSVYVSQQSSRKSLESEATSTYTDDSAYAGPKGQSGHRKLSPGILTHVQDYMSQLGTGGPRRATIVQEVELGSPGLPEQYVPTPRPANEEQRQATVDALGIMAAPPNPQLYNLCRLVCCEAVSSAPPEALPPPGCTLACSRASQARSPGKSSKLQQMHACGS